MAINVLTFAVLFAAGICLYLAVTLAFRLVERKARARQKFLDQQKLIEEQNVTQFQLNQ